MFSIKPVIQSYWDGRAAGNFTFGGTGSGLVIATVLAASFLGLAPTIPILAGLCFIAGGLFLVWLEIGKPWRFINVYRNPFTSWMSREAYAAAALFATALAAIVWPSLPLLWLAALLALAFLFCQARMLQASRGIPAWRDGAIVPLVMATGLVEGTAVLLLYLLVMGTVSVPLGAALIVLLVLRAGAYRIYRDRLRNGRAPTAVVNRLGEIDATVWVLGAIVPLIFAVLALAWPPLAGLSVGIAALCSVFAGWYVKVNIIRRLAHVQGLSVRHMPVRGTGRSGASVQPGWPAKR
jgi:phenylacetyl-CoA:acceptor oxidoreductase subunit 2